MKKKRWKPKVGEKYWFIFYNFDPKYSVGVSSLAWSGNDVDLSYFKDRGIFKTKKEALAFIKKHKAFLNKELGEV